MRRLERQRTEFPEVPERLRECWVEDWVSAGEPQPDWSSESRVFWASLTALRRWSLAVSDWMKDNDVPFKQRRELVPWRRPQWRNPPPE